MADIVCAGCLLVSLGIFFATSRMAPLSINHTTVSGHVFQVTLFYKRLFTVLSFIYDKCWQRNNNVFCCVIRPGEGRLFSLQHDTSKSSPNFSLTCTLLLTPSSFPPKLNYSGIFGQIGRDTGISRKLEAARLESGYMVSLSIR